MKKRFTFLIAALMLLTMITLPEMVKGQTTTTFVAGSNYTANMTLPCEAGGFSWVTSAAPSSFESASPSRGYQYSKVSTNLTTTIENATITKVEVVASTNGNANLNSISVYVGNTQIGETQNMPKENNKTYTFQDTGKSGEIKVAMTNSGGTNNKSTYVKSITVTYTTGGGPTTYTVTYNANNGDNPVPTYADGGHTAGDYTVLPNTDSNLSFAKTGHTFSTWNESQDGTGTGHAPNSTFNLEESKTLYAQWTVNTHNVTMPSADTYGSYSATSSATSGNFEYGSTVTLTYSPATGYENYVASWTVGGTPIDGSTFTMPDNDVTVGVSVTQYVQPTAFDIALNNSLFGTSYTGSVSNITDQNPIVGTQDNVTVNYAGSGNHYVNDSQIRFYPNNKLTFEAPSGYVIKKIVFTADGTWAATISANVGSYTSDTKTWEGSAASVVFTGSGSSRCDMSKAAITLDVPAPEYDITYATGLTNGAFAAGNPTSANAETTVTVATTPNAGYHLATMTYNDGTNTESATINGNSGSFTMPEHAVTVSATFAENVATFTDGVYSEPMTTQASFDNMTVIDKDGDQTWQYNSSYNCAYINGYVSGTSNANEDWLITPKMAVTNGKLAIAFETYHNNYGAGQLSVKWSTALDGTWNDAGFTEGDAGSWVSSNLAITTAASDIYVAFVYVSTSSAAGNWEVRNFTAKQCYPVTYVANGGSGTMTDSNSPYAVGATVTVLGCSFDAPSGETFSHWVKTVGGTAEGNVDPDDTFEMGTEAVTLTAQWYVPAQPVTVQYSVNGTIDNSLSQTVNSGESFTLPSTGNLLNGDFEFVGWSDAPDDVDNIHTASSSYTVYNATTLYAVYSKTESTTEEKVVILDGEAEGLGASILSEETTISENDRDYKAKGIKYQSVSQYATNAFETGNKTIIGGKDAAVCIYNSEAFGEGITKFEIYSNYGASTSVTVGVNFGTTQITSYNSSALNTWSQTLSTANSVYDASSALPAGAKYFCFGIAKDKNSQFQLRITYTETTNTTTKFTRVFIDETPGAALTIAGPSIIPSGKYLDMETYSLTNNNADNFIIEDGAQLITTNAVAATVQKNITAWTIEANSTSNETEKSNGWYFIASPLTSAYTLTGTDMVSGTGYDLYRLNNTMWENYKNTGHSNFTELNNGTGYLYANSADKTINYAGTVKPYTEASNANVKELSAGWNLIGNPYTHDIYIDKAYYKMKADGTDIEPAATSVAIPACTGVVVKSNGNETVTFSTSAPNVTANNSSLQMTLVKANVRGNAVQDKAVVSFNEEMQLGKFIFNESTAKLYIPQNGEDYAIAFSNRQGDVPLYFKAKEVGTYTINFEGIDMDLNGVSLIDVYEGVEIDLSVEPSYTFMGSPADSEARFRIVFRNSGFDATSDIFAYQNGNEIIVSGEGELQVFDVMGRNVMTTTINGVQTIDAMPQGVYIFRMNEKVQKIVVK